jgi:hypothetical protein
MANKVAISLYSHQVEIHNTFSDIDVFKNYESVETNSKRIWQFPVKTTKS